MKINRIKLSNRLSSAMQAVRNFTHAPCNVATLSQQLGLAPGVVYNAKYGRVDIKITQALELKDFIGCAVSDLMDSK